jgi:hypothetical protein
MQKKVIIHSLVITLSTVIIFFFVTDESLSYFSLQLTGLLLLTLLLSHKLLKPASFRLAESTISTMSVLLVCSGTGGISSPLFFLNYLLLFELSVLLEPVIPLVLSACFAVFYFLTDPNQGINPIHLLEFAAFPLMTPMAMILGSLYRKVRNQKKEIKQLSEKMKKLEDELVEEELINRKLEVGS